MLRISSHLIEKIYAREAIYIYIYMAHHDIDRTSHIYGAVCMVKLFAWHPYGAI